MLEKVSFECQAVYLSLSRQSVRPSGGLTAPTSVYDLIVCPVEKPANSDEYVDSGSSLMVDFFTLLSLSISEVGLQRRTKRKVREKVVLRHKDVFRPIYLTESATNSSSLA